MRLRQFAKKCNVLRVSYFRRTQPIEIFGLAKEPGGIANRLSKSMAIKNHACTGAMPISLKLLRLPTSTGFVGLKAISSF